MFTEESDEDTVIKYDKIGQKQQMLLIIVILKSLSTNRLISLYVLGTIFKEEGYKCKHAKCKVKILSRPLMIVNLL